MPDPSVDLRPGQMLYESAPPPRMSCPTILTATLDERTIAYAIAMRKPFEDLRQAAAQLAGILVLAAAGSRAATPAHPLLILAGQTYEEAMDTICATVAPSLGTHHHRHLTCAASWIGRALARARAGPGASGPLDIDATLSMLRRGWRELQWSAGALPGFEIVAFGQACCANHVRAPMAVNGTPTA